MGLTIGAAGWAVVAKRVAKDTFPSATVRGTLVPPRLLWDRLVKPPHMPPERIGNPALPSLWPCIQVLHTLIKGLLQGTGTIHTGGLCLVDCSCELSLCIPDHGCAEGIGLLNGGFGIRYQPFLVEVHGSPSCKQPPHGHIHFPPCSQSTSSDRAPRSAIG